MAVVQFKQKCEAEIVKADLDNGYYRVANELGLALCKVSLSDREHRLVQAVMYKTFGFNKSVDWICNAQLAELTNIGIGHIGETKTRLFSRNILIKNGRQIGVNTVVSEWLKNPKQGLNKKPEIGLVKTRNRVNKNPKQGFIKPETGLHNKQDTITKNNNTKDKGIFGLDKLPEFISKDLWVEFIAMRKSIKKPVTEKIASRMINKLIDFNSRGLNASAALTRTIDNCWADIFEPKPTFGSSKPNQAKTISPTGWKPASTLPGMNEGELL